MSAELVGKVAFVTGGGSGIGQACAIDLAKHGAHVVVVDRNFDHARHVASVISGSGGTALALVADVADDSSVAMAVAGAVKEFGALHIAVNNAGIGGDVAPTADQSVDGWRKVLSVNLDGVFYCMRHEIHEMKKSGGGSIINMASILGAVGYANSAAYVAAKHAVVGLTQTAAIEYATDGIRVNSVGPGFIDTPLLGALPSEVLGALARLHPLNRLGQPQEVANMVTFLASSKASFITGSYYPVDGGYLSR
jgi:NAD(P)-dependent dehydrogenase (short-subunit alcohol dehydrogenase family)